MAASIIWPLEIQGSTTRFGIAAQSWYFLPEVLTRKTSSAMPRSLCAIIFQVSGSISNNFA